MISQIDISGFRSIKEAKIPLKKLNILYGQNGSGKSSVMYAPYVFRNFCVNPNQRLNRLFDLGFMNLGAYEDIASRMSLVIKISKVLKDIDSIKLTYEFAVRKESIGSVMNYLIDDVLQGGVLIEHPYSLDNKIEIENLHFKERVVSWDGLLYQSHENDYKTKK